MTGANPDGVRPERTGNTALLMRRARHGKKLKELLGYTDERGLLQQVWALRTLTLGRRRLAQRLFRDRIPEDADDGLPGVGPIAPWLLETLVNERFAQPPFPPPPRRDGRIPLYADAQFTHVRHLGRLLHAWEDAESGLLLRRMDVMREMPRLTHRQFEWQRGFMTGPAYYRWAWLYGGPRAEAHFQVKNGGLTVQEFMRYGFAAHVICQERPVWRRHHWMREIGFDPETSERALDLLVGTPDGARAFVASERGHRGGPAYQPSLLRRAPIIAFAGGADLVAPLPELISARVTSGLFYDHADAPSDVRNEVGARFEEYVRDIMNRALPAIHTEHSRPYALGKQQMAPPDLSATRHGRLVAVLECKARKMSFQARYSEVVEADPGHEDLAKGVFQLWRYFAHQRLGRVPGPQADDRTVGVLVTLDNWMQMSSARQRHVLALAEAMAARKDPAINAEDRRTVVFCSIEDLEITLSRRDEDGFLSDLAKATEDHFMGWMLPNIYSREDGSLDRPFPFWDRMSDVLPWWSSSKDAN